MKVAAYRCHLEDCSFWGQHTCLGIRPHKVSPCSGSMCVVMSSIAECLKTHLLPAVTLGGADYHSWPTWGEVKSVGCLFTHIGAVPRFNV